MPQRDPDNDGVELYHDRPPEQWPLDREGRLAPGGERLDPDHLSGEPAPE